MTVIPGRVVILTDQESNDRLKLQPGDTIELRKGTGPIVFIGTVVSVNALLQPTVVFPPPAGRMNQDDFERLTWTLIRKGERG